MKKSLFIFTVSAIALGLLVYPEIAKAYQGDPNVKGPLYTEERHATMGKAFETNDYNTWKNLMQGRGRVTQVVNKDNFAKFAQAHKLAEQGNVAEATKIRQELGLGMQNGSGRGAGMGRRSR